jgi:formylglycine-generating enzyme required for sulfatase activity
VVKAKSIVFVVAAAWSVAALAGADYVRISGGTFTSAINYEDIKGAMNVAPFALRARPVTNGEFLAFVRAHPEWARGVAVRTFTGPDYLSQWQAPLALGPGADAGQPVTHVSWFAARAFCQAESARLPTWTEWEYAAAADETRGDARADPAWRERILGWYARPSSKPLDKVGAGKPDVHGVYDLNGLVWEWVEDYGGLLISSDSREQGDANRLRFCAGGALALRDRDNYAVLMRLAMLASLQPVDDTGNLGFRCAKDIDGGTQ